MTYSYKNKAANVSLLNRYMLAKTSAMFEYEGLPDSIPAIELEKMIQSNGYAFVTKANDGELYAFVGGMGGNRDAYGNSRSIIISNPYINFYKTCDLNTDGVLFINDAQKLGLMPIFSRGNTFLAENDINMMLWGYNSRTQKLISASDDNTKESADQYVKKIIEGDISVIGESAMFDGVKVQSSQNGANGTVTQMTEFNQYIKATMYNEIGIASQFNMKRERLISSELDQAEDSLFPLVYNMMEVRLRAVEKLNEMFGLSVKVGFGSVWALKNKQLVDGKVEELPDETHTEDFGEQRAQPTGNDTGSADQVHPSKVDPEKAPVENDVENDDESDAEPDDESGVDSDKEAGRERSRERGQGTDPDSDSDSETDDLLDIINDPEASEEDKKAAKELLDEQEK